MKPAKIAYEKYCEVVGGRSHDGKKLPNWEEFEGDKSKTRQSIAWIHAAMAVRHAAIQECRKVAQVRLLGLEDGQTHTTAEEACGDIIEDLHELESK